MDSKVAMLEIKVDLNEEKQNQSRGLWQMCDFESFVTAVFSFGRREEVYYGMGFSCC